MRFRRIVILFFLAALVAVGYYFFLPVGSGEHIIVIKSGATVSDVATLLRDSSLARSEWSVKLTAKVMGKSIKAGAYKLSWHSSVISIVRTIMDPSNILAVEVTFPEAIMLRRYASISHRELGIDSVKFMRAANDRKFISSLGVDASSLEGYLLPDTYRIGYGATERDVLELLVTAWKKYFDDSIRAFVPKKFSTHEFITLASIVDAEAVVSEERSRIAGLYLNRLAKPMRLEADPTVRYSIGGDRVVTHHDLERESPYNTYLHDGLPPGPINNPGRDALRATARPEEHNYFYFVAKGDGSGEHYFARTFEEHKLYVAKYARAKAHATSRK